MRNVDRILRIIYRNHIPDIELSFPFMSAGLELKNYKKGFFKNEFDFDNLQFIKQIKTNYLNVYPENYSGDELDTIFYSQKEMLLERFQNQNAALLFPLYAEKLFEIYKGKLHVKYDYLLDYNGISNKVDNNIFLSAYAALVRNKELLKVEGGLIQHNNNRIYNILKSGLSENHMHLKGSGYTTELSWEKIINSEIFHNKELKYFIENDNNFLDYKSKNKSTEKLLIFFTKMKVIKKLLLLNMDVNSEENQSESLLYKALTTKYFELLRMKDYNQMKIVSLGLTDCKLVWDSEMFDSLTEPYEKEYYRDLKYIKEKVMYGEREFLYNCFKLLLENNLSDTMQNLFNFYLIGLNFFKYELLQDNIGMGFQKFKEKENIKDLIIDNNNLIYISVFDKYYSEKCVEKIEFRIAPNK